MLKTRRTTSMPARTFADNGQPAKLPPNWRWVSFGEVVRNVNESERDPISAGLERYVGMEHLEPENLYIKEWGHLGDGVSFKKRFRKGQTLFGKRRAYQRKVAVAEFDGICSSDILTFEPAGDELLPEFLPFIVQSNGFFQHALGTSSGSLSPRTRWSQLQDYSFALPPKARQSVIAEPLWAAAEAAGRFSEASETARVARNVAHDKLTAMGAIPGNWRMSRIGEACLIQNNLRKPINADTRGRMKGAYPYYGPTGILDYIDEYRVEGRFVLIGEDGDHFLKFADWDMTQLVEGKFNVNNHAHILRGRDGCRTEWVFHFFKHRDIQPYLSKQGSGRMKLQKSVLEEMPIPLPPINEQDRIIAILDEVDAALAALKSHAAKCKAMAVLLRERCLMPETEERQHV